MRVAAHEVDEAKHNSYLAIIGKHAPVVGDAMECMARAAGRAGRSESDTDLTLAAEAMEVVGERARAFLRALNASGCPEYMRGADGQLHDALKLISDAGRRGESAARAREVEGLVAAANEIDTATDDILAASAQIADWRSGAARP